MYKMLSNPCVLGKTVNVVKNATTLRLSSSLNISRIETKWYHLGPLQCPEPGPCELLPHPDHQSPHCYAAFALELEVFHPEPGQLLPGPDNSSGSIPRATRVPPFASAP